MTVQLSLATSDTYVHSMSMFSLDIVYELTDGR